MSNKAQQKLGALAVVAYLFLWLSLGFLTPLSVHARDVSQARGNLILTPNHGGGEGWGKSRCSSCHALFRVHDSVPKIKKMVEDKKFGSCAGCHGQNGTSMKQRCLICHNPKDMPGIPHRTGRHRHDFSLLKTRPTSDQQCLACHDASDMDGNFRLDRDLTLLPDVNGIKSPYTNISEFCLRCHNDVNPHDKYPIVNAGRRDQAIKAEFHYRFVDKHGEVDGFGEGLYTGIRLDQYEYKSIVECVDCHTMHGTRNASNLIIDDSRKAKWIHEGKLRKTKNKRPGRVPGTFEIRVLDDPTFIDNPDEDSPPTIAGDIDCNAVKQVRSGNYSQLCVVCHDMKSRPEAERLPDADLRVLGGNCDTGNGLSGVHFNEGTNCVTCHYHGRPGISGL